MGYTGLLDLEDLSKNIPKKINDALDKYISIDENHTIIIRGISPN